MGCFLSSTKKTPPNSNTKLQTTTTTHRSPPLTFPFLEQEEVKEILSETPIIINNPIIKNNIPQKEISLEKNQCHNIHDSHVFKIARIFNHKELNRVGSDPKEMAKELSRNIRVGSDPKEPAKRLNRVGSDPKESTKHLDRHIRVGLDSKEMGKELSRSIRVGSDPKESVRELYRVGSDLKEATKHLDRHIWVGSDSKETTRDFSRSIRVGSDPKETIKDVRQRSPAKHRNTSPARRSDHISGSGQIRNTSPAKRSDHLSRSGQIRYTSPAKRTDHISGSGYAQNSSLGRVGQGKNPGGLSRKDNGETSCRRSRSPVICGDQNNGGTRNSISRCPSARKSGKSPGRVRSELGDRRRSPAEVGNNNYKRSLTSGNNESIENPLVSLECFIFI